MLLYIVHEVRESLIHVSAAVALATCPVWGAYRPIMVATAMGRPACMGHVAMMERGWGRGMGEGGLVVGAGMEGTEEGMIRCMIDRLSLVSMLPELGVGVCA